MGTFGPLFIISRRWRRVTHLIETLVKMKINYPPKILCQTVSFYLLHRDNISKIACKYPLPASILYYVQVMNAEGAKWGFLQWGTLSSENAYSKTKPVLGGKHQALQFEHGYLYSGWKFLRGRKGHHRTTRWSNSPGTLPARGSLGSALSKSNKNLCWKAGPWGHWLFWIPAPSANSPETLQGNRNQGGRLSHLRNYWRVVQSFCVHPFS